MKSAFRPPPDVSTELDMTDRVRCPPGDVAHAIPGGAGAGSHQRILRNDSYRWVKKEVKLSIYVKKCKFL